MEGREGSAVSFRFWQGWLQAVSAASALFGLLFLIAPGSSLLAGYNQQVTEAFHGASPPGAALDQQRWALAVIGSARLGWSILLLWVTSVPFGRREPWAWRCVALSVGTWAVADSLVSYRAGITLEVVWNAVVVAMVALPLAMTYRAMDGRAGAVERAAAAATATMASPRGR